MSFENFDINLAQEDVYRCINCKSIFKSKHTLNLHEKTSVKCSNLLVTNENSDTLCKYCNKNLSSKQMYKYHQSKCVEKMKHDIIKGFEIEIQNIQTYYENIIRNLQSQLRN